MWVIKIKSLQSFARVVRRVKANRARNADHAARTYERVVYFIVKITRLYEYQKSQINLLRNSRGVQRYVGFFRECAFCALIGWADKHRSHSMENAMMVTLGLVTSILIGSSLLGAGVGNIVEVSLTLLYNLLMCTKCLSTIWFGMCFLRKNSSSFPFRECSSSF